MLLGVPKLLFFGFGLVWMGLMNVFQMMCQILEKRILSLAFLLESMSAVWYEICVFWLVLAFLWLKVAKNYGIAEIRVVLGRIFGVSLAQSSEETWCLQNSCLFWILKFCSVGELSCWGCELEIECQIAYPSVTGKVQNLQKK